MSNEIIIFVFVAAATASCDFVIFMQGIKLFSYIGVILFSLVLTPKLIYSGREEEKWIFCSIFIII